MSTKRTIINADEELVIKGKLTIEGNVTQIETTQQVTNLQGNVFTINSDSSNTSAVLALNSNGTVASFTFDNANGNIVVNKPIIFTSGNVTAPIFVGNVIGNVTGFVSSISNFTTNSLSEGLNNLYYTVARANTAIQGYVSIVDAGGDGSLSLSANSSQLVITYTGPSQAEANTRIDARLSGGDGVDYTSGVIAVDSTVVRTTGTQTITGNTTFVGTTSITGNIIPTTSNVHSLGNATNLWQNVYANVLYAKYLDLGDANIADIHERFFAGAITGPYLTTNTAGGLIYQHNATSASYQVNAGAGLTIDGNGALSIANTVITTAGGQTINGNLTLTGNLNVVNIDSQTQTDSVVTDKVLYLNVGGGASPNNSRVSVEKTAANVYIEYDSRWKFTNDGANVNNILLFTDFSAGNGLSYNNTGGYAVVAGTGISAGANVAVDNTVIRTTGDQTVTGNTTFVGTLVIPSSNATANGAIFTRGPQVFAYVDGIEKELTPQVDIGVVTTADAGNTGIDVYAGLQMVGNITTHFIRSIDGGTYTTSSVASNVITIDGNITAIRGSLSTANVAGYGNLSYNSSNGLFSYSGVTDSQIRTLFSGSGLITYNSANGSITTSADNYGSWTVETDSGAGATKTISSSEKLTIQGGTNITVTNTGNVITIVNDNVADIESVAAGDGLTGGGNSGNVTLNIGAGDGITVNADNVAVNVAYVRSQFSTSGDLSYNASTGVFSFTNDAGDIEGVTAGNGLIGGGTTGTVTLNIGAGTGITVNADDVAVNATYVKGLFSATDSGGDGSFSYSDGVFTYTGPSQAEANTRIDARLSGGTGITYTSGVIATTITQYTDALARAAVSVTDAGGDGSLSYNSSTGVITYTGPSASEVRAHITGGDGLTYSSGVLAVGAGSYITVAADTVAVDATTTNTAGKVVARDGAGNVYANYFVGTATAAQYADLAENYLADAEYEPGTVLVFGGEAEVTAAITYDSTRVAGVVTTQPAHVMNSHLEGPNVACIALRGRVPVKVKGVVRKGDVLVSAGEGFVGYAVAALYPRDVPAAAMVGKAIGDKLDAGPGVVEALI
jgi:hypothetical protein